MMKLILIASILAGGKVYEKGPVPCHVDRVRDGDTIVVTIEGWPPIIGHEIGIRLAKVQCPEMHWMGKTRDPHPEYRKIAAAAKSFVAERMSGARRIELHDVSRDKFFRIDARVVFDGKDLGEELLKAGLARPWDGQGEPPWK